MRFERIDHSKNPSQTVGTDDRRACAGKPTWWWFALPFERSADSKAPKGSDFPDDDLAFKGGDDAEARRVGHDRALILCASCPLALRCLRASWQTEEYGVYGAVSEVERFYLGGRGRSTSQPRTIEKYDKTLRKIAKRYGSDLHPVVRWLKEQPLPRGLTREESAPVVAELVPTEDRMDGAA